MSQQVTLSRRTLLRLLGQVGAAPLLAACQMSAPAEQPDTTGISWMNIPRWRGFNLQNKFNYDNPEWNQAYHEWDLDFMAEFGFDFIRLPMDYRIWTQSPGSYREPVLQEIDQLIAWAGQRKIHVCLCLHRAPGYRVGRVDESFNLWGYDAGSDEARKQFTDQWRMFATRYKDIPAADLSFNLVNEPPEMTGKHYIQVIEPAINAIREQNPQRLIIADGLNYARWTVPELVKLKLAQSTRGYEPYLISHYQASWVTGADTYPAPVWPVPVMLNHYLYGDIKRDLQSALILKGDFSQATELRITVQQVSARAELLVSANGATIMRQAFKPGPGQGEWKESVFQPQWNNYIATYDRELSATLPANTTEIRVENISGDWLTFSDITLAPFAGVPNAELRIKADDSQWSVRQEPINVDSAGRLSTVTGEARFSQKTLWRDHVDPWRAFSTQQHVAVLVGEWGAYNHTPHEVVLAWMRDCLANWKQANMGWALWELRGAFGVLDSQRSDVQYEDYKGHKLDRKMLELLRQG